MIFNKIICIVCLIALKIKYETRLLIFFNNLYEKEKNSFKIKN